MNVILVKQRGQVNPKYYKNKVMFACLSVYLWFNHTKTTELISMKFCTTMTNIPGFEWHRPIPVSISFSFQNGGITTCQIGIFYS